MPLTLPPTLRDGKLLKRLFKRVPSVSKAQTAIDRRYSVLKPAWFAEPVNQWCALDPGTPATDLHHSRGRRRRLKNYQRLWVPLSAKAHDWVHRDADQMRDRLAIAMGLLPERGQWDTFPTELQSQVQECRLWWLRYLCAIESGARHNPCMSCPPAGNLLSTAVVEDLRGEVSRAYARYLTL